MMSAGAAVVSRAEVSELGEEVRRSIDLAQRRTTWASAPSRGVVKFSL